MSAAAVVPASLPAAPANVVAMRGGGSRLAHPGAASVAARLAQECGGEVAEAAEQVAALEARWRRSRERAQGLLARRQEVFAADRDAAQRALVEGTKPPAAGLPKLDRDLEEEASQVLALTAALDRACTRLLDETLPAHGPAEAAVLEERAGKLRASASEARAAAEAAEAEAAGVGRLIDFLCSRTLAQSGGGVPVRRVGVGRLPGSEQ